MIIIIHGSSGSGKTLAGEHLKTLGVKELVSHTTRKKRPGEIHGNSYYFVNDEEFMATKKVEESLYAGELYGVSEQEVTKHKDQMVFAVTDKNGVRAFCKRFKNEVVVIKITTSPRNMRERMKKRGESRNTIHNRMKIFREDSSKEKKIISDYTIDNNSSKKLFLAKLDFVFIKVKKHKFE